MLFVYISGDKKDICTLDEFKKKNPNIVFPDTVTDQFLNDIGLYELTVSDQPKLEESYLTSHYVDVEVNQRDGAWFLDYVVKQYDTATAEFRSRHHRNELLSSSDWTQLADCPVNSAFWATYRQELRDIPEQEGFPYNVVWPTEPS